jgi:hypothetical protein
VRAGCRSSQGLIQLSALDDRGALPRIQRQRSKADHSSGVEIKEDWNH